MPQFGTPNASVSFPGWVLPSHLTNIAWHPHPATVRATGRTVTKADDKLRPWASRHYGRLSWGPDQPIGPGYELPNWEWFWFDMVPVEPHFSKGSTGTSATSNRVDIEQRYIEAMPLTGQPGVQILHTFFSRGEIIGSRFTEFPDNASPFQYDTGTAVPPSAGALRVPADDVKPGIVDFRHFESWPVPECWRWWNTHQLTPCQLEIDPAGIGSKLVKLSGFNWVNGLGTGGKITSAQRRFADLINRSHVVEPVWYGGGLGWYPCYLVKIGGPVFDREATWTFPPDDSGRYDFAVTLEPRIDPLLQFIQFDVRLHVKMSPGKSALIWPTIPFGSDTKFWDQFGGWSGQLFRAFHAGMSTGLPWDPPQDLSNLDAFEIADEIMPKDSTPSWGDLMTDGFVTLGEPPDQETVGLPQQGVLEVSILAREFALSRSDGSTPSTTSGVAIPLDTPLFDVGGWWQPATTTNGFIVPAGVTHIKAAAGCYAGNSANSQSIEIRNQTTPWDVHPYQRTKPDFSTEGLISLQSPILPVTPGDEIAAIVTKASSSLKADQRFNWLYVESVQAESLDLTDTLVDAGVAIPSVGTQWMLAVVSSIQNGWSLSEAQATYIDQVSSTPPLILDIRAIRKSTRALESLCDTSVQIDAGDWSSIDSSTPFVPSPSTSQVFTGDILVAEVVQSPNLGQGLVLTLSLKAPFV